MNAVNKIYAYYKVPFAGRFAVELYSGNRWIGSFIYDGNKEGLYAECDKRVARNEGRLEALIEDDQKSSRHSCMTAKVQMTPLWVSQASGDLRSQ